MAEDDKIDLGHGFSMSYFGWLPERAINPQYERPDKPYPRVFKAGIVLDCPHTSGAVYFDLPDLREFKVSDTFWTIVQWEPLTLSPSISVPDCGCHGYIREGKWVPA